MKKYLCLLCVLIIAASASLSSCKRGNHPDKLPEENDHTHSFSESVTKVDPTCTEDGKTASYCICGESEIIVIPALGHDYDDFGNCSVCQAYMPATEGVLYEENLDGGYAEVVGYIGEATTVVVADEYHGLPVTSIAPYAFADKEQIASVILPESMIYIEYYAFRGCSSLSNVSIGAYVRGIGSGAFNGCNSLSSFYIKEDNLKFTEIDGSLYTKDKTTLLRYAAGRSGDAFTIPDGVTHIGYGAFYGTEALRSVVIPEGVISIGECAFTNCDSLLSVVIPDSVENIGDYAFQHCISLSSLSLGSSLKSIGCSAFSSCTSLMSVFIPKSVTSIKDYAFSSCLLLSLIEVDTKNTSYTSIGGNLYTKDGKTLIQYAIGRSDASFTVPDGVTMIDKGAFSHCTSLKSVEMPGSLSFIGENAFAAAYSLKDVHYGDTEAQWKLISIEFGNDPLLNCTIRFSKNDNDVAPPDIEGGLGWG